MRKLWYLAICLVLLLTPACTRHKVETHSRVELAPVEVKPIHITIDINIRVDRALDDFFGDLDEAREEVYEKKVKK
jgi:hypothetical protein